MISSRAFLFSFLSVICVGTFLYYTIIPQGPRLLQWKQPSIDTDMTEVAVSDAENAMNPIDTDTTEDAASDADTAMSPIDTDATEIATSDADTAMNPSSETFTKAEKFTPESAYTCLPAQGTRC